MSQGRRVLRHLGASWRPWSQIRGGRGIWWFIELLRAIDVWAMFCK